MANKPYKDYEERRREFYLEQVKAFPQYYGSNKSSQNSDERVVEPEAYSDQPVSSYVAPAIVRENKPDEPNNHYLANPQNVNRLYTQYQLDENFNDSQYNREDITALNDYYSAKNKGKPIEEWGQALKSDPISTFIDKLPDRRSKTIISENLYGYVPTEKERRAFLQPREIGHWDDLDMAGKIGLATDMSADLHEAGTTWQAVQKGTKVIQGTAGTSFILGSAGSLLGAGIGALFGGVGAVPGAMIGGKIGAGGGALLGLTGSGYEAVTGEAMPIYKEIQDAFNYGAAKIEQGLGTVSVIGNRIKDAAKRGYNEAEGRGLKDEILSAFEEMGEEFSRSYNERGDIWEASKNYYETGGKGLGDIWGDILTSIFTKPAEGAPTGFERWNHSRTDYKPENIYTGSGETYRWNEGISGKRKLDDDATGIRGMETLIEMRRNMRAQGLTDNQIDEVQTMLVNDTAGYSGKSTDQLAQSIIDPMNFLNVMSAATLGKIADITGDSALKSAVKAHQGSIIADALPNVWDDIYTALTGQNKTGGLTQIGSIYLDALGSMNVDKLTPFQRVMSGITNDGVLNRFAKRDYNGRMGWIKRLADETPESKVIGLEGVASNILRTVLADTEPEEIRHVLRQMAGMDEIDPSNPYHDYFNSAEVRTIRPYLAEILNAENGLAALTSYELSTIERGKIRDVAQALKMSDEEAVRLYRDKRNVFDEMVGKITSEDNAPAYDLTDIHHTFDNFIGEKPLPFQKDSVRARVVNGLTDKIGDALVKEYGIQPDGNIWRFSNVVKGAQSLVLLGLNPTYYINNVVNNVVTRAATGVFGFLTGRQIQEQEARLGFTPARMNQSNVGARSLDLYMTDDGGIQAKIGNAKRKDDLINSASNVISAINDNVGIFNKLSSAAEVNESNQAIAIGIGQYMNRVWEQGDSAPKLPDYLRSSLGDELSNQVEKAIRSSWNMDEIDQKLFAKDYVKPEAGQILADTFRKIFGNEAGDYSEMFVKTGIADELMARIKNADSEAEVNRAVSDVIKRAEEYNSVRVLLDTIAQAENIRARVENEGYYAVSDTYRELAVARAEHWLSSRQRWNEAYGKIRRTEYNRKVITLLNEAEQSGWQKINQLSLQSYQGIVSGLGFSEEFGRDYMRLATEIQENWESFYQKKKESFDVVAAEAEKSADRQSLWDAWRSENDELYFETVQKEIELQRQTDEVFLKGFAEATGLDIAELAGQFEAMRLNRVEMNNLQREAHDYTRDHDYSDNAKYFKENFNPRYNALIQSLYDGIENIGKTIDDVQESVGNVEVGRVKAETMQRMTPLEAMKTQDMSDKANEEKRAAEGKVNNWMRRMEIREAFLDSGASVSTVDLVMGLYDATEKAWKRNAENQGLEYYLEAERLSKRKDIDGKSLLHQSFDVLTGKKAIDIGNTTDFEKMIYKSLSSFQRTLGESLMRDYAEYLGFKSVEDYQLVDNFYRRNRKSLNEAQIKHYMNAQEKFAQGFSEFLTNDTAVNDSARVLYQNYASYLSDIYRVVRTYFNDDEEAQKQVFSAVVPGSASGGKLSDYLDKIHDNPFKEVKSEEVKPVEMPVSPPVIQDPEKILNDYRAGKAVPFGSILDVELDGSVEVDHPKLDLVKREFKGNNAKLKELRDYLQASDSEAANYKFLNLTNDEVNKVENARAEQNYERQRKTTISEKTKKPVVVGVNNLIIDNYEIAGRVYLDGETVALLPKSKHNLDRFIDWDGKQILILGLDPDDTDNYVVYNEGKTYKVKSNGLIAVPASELSEYVLRPVKHNGVPVPMPEGLAGNEIYNKYIVSTLTGFEREYSQALEEAKRSGKMKDIPLEARVELEKFLDQNVRQSLGIAKYHANKYAESQRDYAMLNYSKRYGWDRFATIAFPYQFFFTRSFGTWARRMIDRPEYYRALYDRDQTEELYREDEDFPKRLNGRYRIPLGGVPEWMGNSYFTKLGQINPLNTFFDPLEQWEKGRRAVTSEAERLIGERFENGEITKAEYDMAMTHEGGIWESAYMEANQSRDDDTSVGSLMSQYFSPNIFASWAIKKSTGKEKDIGILPSTRTGNMIGAVTSGTALEPAGEAIKYGLSLPERGLRKLYGLNFNEFGEKWGEYYVAKQLAQMAADGVITHQQAREAMVTKTGDAYNQAIERQRQENLVRNPGGVMLAGVKEALGSKGSPEMIPAALANLLSSGLIYPTGERVNRESYRLLQEAYEAKANGDKDALRRFYQEHPENKTVKMTFTETPDEMLRMFYDQRIRDKFYSMPKEQQLAVKRYLGADFEVGYLKNNGDGTAVPLEKLAEWATLLSGQVPNLPSSPKPKAMDERILYSAATLDQIEAHDSELTQRFPQNIQDIQDRYFEYPSKEERKAYLEANPVLREYWNWEKQFRANNPLYAQYKQDSKDYYKELELYDVYQDLSERTLNVLDMISMKAGTELPTAVRRELERAYTRHRKDGETFDEFVKRLTE